MRASVSELHELERVGGSQGWRKGDGNGGERRAVIPQGEEENEGCGGQGKTPQRGKRETGEERERQGKGREDGETDKRTHGAVDGVRSRGRREGGSLCRPADRKASFAEADRWGILRLKTGENNPTGNETNSIRTSRFSGPDLLQP